MDPVPFPCSGADVQVTHTLCLWHGQFLSDALKVSEA